MTAPTIVARGHRPGAEPTGDARPRRHRGVLALALGLLVLAVVVSVLTARSTSDVPLAPDNPDPDGARALAQVLREQGVSVTYVRTTAAALAEAGAGTTLLVLSPETLRTEQREALAGVAADVVLADVGWGDLAPLTSRVRVDEHAVRESRPAGCDDPHAQAAGEVTSGGPVLSGTDAVLCFAGPEGAGYAAWTEGDRQWRAIADGWVLSNDGIATEGNAALVLRTLGAHDRLVWYLPSEDDPYGTGTGGGTDPFPLPGPALLLLALVGLVVVLWQGRRLGPVVVERLPVVVRASETTRGRGRLYRRAGAHAHAAAALRAGLVARLAGRVGLPSHAPPHQVVETLARASGRSEGAVHDVLYGPPPTDDAGLIALTQALDTLDREVQRG